MTFKNNRPPVLSNIKLYASFHHHMWIQTGVTARKRLSWVMTSVTLTFELWPWPFAWTSLLSLVITPENFVAIQWQEHSKKGVTDRRTERGVFRVAWSQLKICGYMASVRPFSKRGLRKMAKSRIKNVHNSASNASTVYLWYLPLIYNKSGC